MQRGVGADAFDNQFIERLAHARQGLAAVFAVADDLGDQRVVKRRHRVAVVNVRIDPHARAAGRVEDGDAPRGGHKGLRVFRVDATFQRMPAKSDLVLAHGDGQAAGNAQLFAHDIHARDQFCDGMFHLYPGVHLDKVKAPVFVEKFEGARAAISDVVAGFDAGAGHLAAGRVVDIRRRRLFDDFLVPPLQGAVPIAQVDGLAFAVGDDLDFHVPRPL